MTDEQDQNVGQELQKIKERNIRVEAEKAWEGSAMRIGTIVLITYLVACAILFAIGNDHPLRNALIPPIGFFLSTQSLPFLKKRWISAYLSHRTK
jgi:hypothetical protein